ncbi:type II toxin-antitoxin system VapC family toxin [Roseofilum sp. BLCC_M154]|uniref:Type II toxin-antitoxin system VapC family toxin n=1 Tax=Roseofilum acuticapitatum BLCC-M154 TaxID=3022444 RepID=A0ABT7AWM7_9CYAN|nr:type II toxin-antitoxin system VapC family toxin [Roseofilum acuticapitatum]MDJ1171317.1 type II toxin-antitoxin system VapC family toxin [Roseofilum acuticapitatum BLCC-M154]
MYLLDTNHCSRIIQGDRPVINRIIEVGESQVATCVIVQGELLYMAYKSEQKARNLAQVNLFLEDIRIYRIDEVTANIYAEFKAEILEYFGPKERNKRRKIRIENLGIGENDLWIAAIALRNGLTLVSGDRDFQRMQAVKALPLESWLAS